MTEEPKKKEKVPRQKMPEQEPKVRARNFEEVPLGYSPETAQLEASRCLQCKKPSCVEGCPVQIDIPGFIREINQGDFSGAIMKLWEKTSLPAVCGRVCPQEAQCEQLCILGKKDEPVAVGRLERFASDYQRTKGEFKLPHKAEPTGKKVAVIGSGPSGLTVAGDLILKGHEVTIFEAFHKPGGVLVYGIPEFRLPKAIVEAEVNILEKLGGKIVCNAVIGRTQTIEELMTEEGFDAVYVGVGAGLPVFMNLPGENLIGIYSANEYLTRSNLMKAYLFPQYDTPLIIGKERGRAGGRKCGHGLGPHGLAFGGQQRQDRLSPFPNGDARPGRGNPPCRGRRGGIVPAHQPTKFIGDDQGRVVAMECIKMELGEPDASGRRRPVPMKGSEFTLDTDLVVIAIGAGANPLITATTPGLKTNKRGYIVADEKTGKTLKRGVWAGGDIVTGSATVILAMGAGRLAANSIHEYLTIGW